MVACGSSLSALPPRCFNGTGHRASEVCETNGEPTTLVHKPHEPNPMVLWARSRSGETDVQCRDEAWHDLRKSGANRRRPTWSKSYPKHQRRMEHKNAADVNYFSAHEFDPHFARPISLSFPPLSCCVISSGRCLAPQPSHLSCNPACLCL